MLLPFDILLGTVLVGFILWGLWFGLLHSLGSLLGTIVGVIVASKFQGIWSQTNLGRLITFIVLYTVVSRLISFLFMLLERTFRMASVIPGLKLLNRLAGAVFGFFEGSIVIGAVLYFLNLFPLGNVASLINASSLAPFFMRVGAMVVPMVPDFINRAREAGLY